MDHLLPRSRGGEHTWHNVVLMCEQHNNAKSDRTLEELGWSLKTSPRVPSYDSLYLHATQVLPQWQRWLSRSHTVEELAAS